MKEKPDSEKLKFYRIAREYDWEIIHEQQALLRQVTGRGWPEPPKFKIPDEYK